MTWLPLQENWAVARARRLSFSPTMSKVENLSRELRKVRQQASRPAFVMHYVSVQWTLHLQASIPSSHTKLCQAEEERVRRQEP